jgi:hypothetical protein
VNFFRFHGTNIICEKSFMPSDHKKYPSAWKSQPEQAIERVGTEFKRIASVIMKNKKWVPPLFYSTSSPHFSSQTNYIKNNIYSQRSA